MAAAAGERHLRAGIAIDVLQTPDSRFEQLPGYPFAPHYCDVAAADTGRLRMHYVAEGPTDGPPIVLLHGNPTWSYLYRNMIGPLADGGHRVLAPDLIGFGRSDKPSQVHDYTYLRHVQWVTSWFEHLDLTNVTLFVQDWGSLIGLRIAAEQGNRIARIVVANGFLPAGQWPIPPAFRIARCGAPLTGTYRGALRQPGNRHPACEGGKGGLQRAVPGQAVSGRDPGVPRAVADKSRGSCHARKPRCVGHPRPTGQAVPLRVRDP